MPTLEPLFTESQIQGRIDELATTIRNEIGEDEDVILIGILKGSIPFLADLSRRLGNNVLIDTMRVSSYGDGMRSSGVVQIVKDLELSIEGMRVLIVEDIVDTGATLSYLLEFLGTRRPKSLDIVALLSKTEARTHNLEVRHIGFEIPNAFVVGYGLDLAERYRNLPYIAIYRES